MEKNELQGKSGGLFITFEGGEGVGKSTQVKLLSECFETLGVPYIKTREPGGCLLAEKLRECLLYEKMSFWTEALLMMAARYEHWNETIAPALHKGYVVLCDRFFDSSVAYQGYGRGIPINFLKNTFREMPGLRDPDITFLFRMGVSQSLKRKPLDQFNRFEKECDGAFHQRVFDGYTALTCEFPQRIVSMNACNTPQDIHKSILNILKERYTII